MQPKQVNLQSAQPYQCIGFTPNKPQQPVDQGMQPILGVPGQPQPISKTINQYTFEINSMIGDGEFSKVYVGINNETQGKVAIKVIDKRCINSKQIYQRLLENEINILSTINHKAILNMHEHIETANNHYIITDYCKDGDLYEIIQKNGHIPEHNAVKILRHMIKALLYLKEQGIIHRDIKPQNMLLSDQIPKLADFGFAIKQQQFRDPQFQIGTPLYMSPETFFFSDYSGKSDIWSLGIVFFEMLTGTVPFKANSKQELEGMLRKYKQDGYLDFGTPCLVSSQGKDLLTGMLQFDVNIRFDIAQVANHPIIQNPHPNEKRESNTGIEQSNNI